MDIQNPWLAGQGTLGLVTGATPLGLVLDATLMGACA